MSHNVEIEHWKLKNNIYKHNVSIIMDNFCEARYVWDFSNYGALAAPFCFFIHLLQNHNKTSFAFGKSYEHRNKTELMYLNMDSLAVEQCDALGFLIRANKSQWRMFSFHKHRQRAHCVCERERQPADRWRDVWKHYCRNLVSSFYCVCLWNLISPLIIIKITQQDCFQLIQLSSDSSNCQIPKCFKKQTDEISSEVVFQLIYKNHHSKHS